MAGLLDFLAGSSDPSTADPTTGLVDAQRKQLAYGILGQTGAALLAAGAPSYPGQQGQYLAQLGRIPGNIAEQQSQMVNQNAMAQQVKLRQAKVEQEKAAAAYIQTPEYQNMLTQLPDVLKSQAMVNIKAGDYGAATKVVTDYVQMQIQAAREKAKLNLPMMTHDAAGNPIVFYPGTGEVKPIGGTTDPGTAYGIGPVGQASGGTSANNAPTGQSTLPDGTPITDQQANPYPNASINPNLPYNKAFGLGGATTYALGRTQGTTGLGTIGPQTALQNAAVAQFDKMRTELVNEARAEAPGSSRLKSVYTAINDTLPVAGSAFHDAPYALKQLAAAKDSLSKELENTTRLFQAPATKPAEKAKLAQDIMSIRKNLDNVRIVVDGLSQGQGGSNPAQSSERRSRYNPATGKIE